MISESPESVVTTDKRKAFMHNCCKKLAQLGRVSFEMACQNETREDELAEIHKEMDQAVADLITQHVYYQGVIGKQLVRYRKDCVHKACDEFGVLYKARKAELAKAFAEHGKRIKEIMADVKEMRKSMRAATMESLKSAELFLKRADAVEAKLKAMGEAIKNPDEQEAKWLSELNAKIEQAERAHGTRLDQMKTEHKQKMESCRGDADAAIRKAVREKTGKVQRAKERLSKCQEAVSKMKEECDKMVTERRSFWREKSKERNNIVSETNKTVRGLRGEIREKKEKLRKMEEMHRREVDEMERQREASLMENKKDIRAIRRAISSHRKERHGSARTKRREMMQKAEETRQNSQSAQCVFEKVLREKKEKQEKIGSSFTDGVKDTDRIKADMRQAIAAALGRMEANRLELKKRLKEQEERVKKHFAGKVTAYRSEKDRDLAAFESQLSDLCRGGTILKALSTASLKEELRKEEKLFAGEMAAAKKKQDDARKTLVAANQKEKGKQVADQEDVIKAKVAEHKKAMARLDQSFSKDLDAKKASLRGKALEKLKAAKESANSGDVESQEMKEKKLSLQKLKARLEVVQKALDDQKGADTARREKFTAEMMLVEKQVRKFERRKRAEMQRIGEEYEMKIQVEQVQLKNKIENIAKLYSAEENARGKEIIEAIRKVREVENLQADGIVNDRRERQEMRKQHQIEMARVKDEISQYKDNKREKKLQQEISSLKDRIAKANREITDKYNALIAGIKKEISQYQDKTTNSTRELADARAKDQKDYDEKVKEIKARRKEILDKTEQEKKQLAAEFDKNMASMRTKHQKSVESMKNRVQNAKSINTEYRTKWQQEKQAAVDKLAASVNSEFNAATKKMSAQFSEARTSIIDAVKTKRTQVTNSKTKSFVPECRRQEVDLAKKTFAKVKDESALIARFKEHESTMLRIFQVKKDKEAPSLLSSSHSGEFCARGKKQIIAPTPLISS